MADPLPLASIPGWPPGACWPWPVNPAARNAWSGACRRTV